MKPCPGCGFGGFRTRCAACDYKEAVILPFARKKRPKVPTK